MALLQEYSSISEALGLGPVGAHAHSEQEKIDLGTLPMQTQRAAWLIYRLTQK